MDNQVYIIAATIGASAALVGAIIGGIVSYQVARLQFNASVVQANRREWVNQFRNAVAEYGAAKALWKFAGGLPSDRAFELTERMVLAHQRIYLFLDHTNQTHSGLLDLLNSAKGLEGETIGSRLADISIAASQLMKAEYQKMEGQSEFWNTFAKKWPVWLIIILLLSLNYLVWFK
jgi:hypothetical protein